MISSGLCLFCFMVRGFGLFKSSHSIWASFLGGGHEIISAALASLALARIARYGLEDGLPNIYLAQSRQVAKSVLLDEVKICSNQSVDQTPAMLSRQVP